MRVNIYAEEMTEQLEIISKEIDGHNFTGLRLYLHLPVTLPNGENFQGPFMHRPGDDDSSAVTFWGKRDLRVVLRKALAMLDTHYGPAQRAEGAPTGMVLLPRELTAENGAKYKLTGEFKFQPFEDSPPVVVPWVTIKEIHRRVVQLFGPSQSHKET